MSNLRKAILEMFNKTELQEIAYHGCASVAPTGLTYYNETSNFYDKHENEILDVLDEMDFPEEARQVIHILKNNRVWAALEIMAQELAGEIESIAESLKEQILNTIESRAQAIAICKSHASLKYTDITEGVNGEYTDIFVFIDDSELKIGTDNSIFLDTDEEIQYLKS